jgi:hypothetical protein
MAAIGKTRFARVWLFGRGWLAGVGLLCVANCSYAQDVHVLNSSTMEFSDQQFGVSFRYPTSWSFSLGRQFFIQLAITPGPNAPEKDNIRALIYTESISGVPPWPRTRFEGAEFGYDAHSVPSTDACVALAKTSFEEEVGRVDEVTIQGNRFWHLTTGEAGLGHQLDDEVYALYSSGSCLRFDLAVSFSSLSEDPPAPRYLTAHEKALINASLRNILNSVRITPPAR